MNHLVLETASLLLVATNAIASPPDATTGDTVLPTPQTACETIRIEDTPRISANARVMLGVLSQDTQPAARRVEGSNIFVIKNHKGDFKIELRDGQATATKDGKALDSDQVKVEADQITLYDDDGKVILSIPRPTGQSFGVGVTNSMSGADVLALLDRPRIGITMGALDPALAKHLRIDNPDAFIVTHVMEDMPAAKGGLKQYDVVVRINDQSASQALLREIVSKGKAGQEVRLRVIRAGEPRDIAITLEKVEAPEVTGEFVWQGRTIEELRDHDVDLDLDIKFDESFDVESESIRRHIEEAMRGDRFGKIVERLRKLESIPALRELGFEEIGELNELRIELNEVSEIPRVILREFGPGSEVWEEVQQSLQETLKELDPETRAKIESAVKHALDKASPALRGLLHRAENPEPMTFELFDTGEGKQGLIMLRESKPIRIKVREEGDASVGEMKLKVEAARPSESDPSGQAEGERTTRLDDLETRLDRLETLLRRIEEQLQKRD